MSLQRPLSMEPTQTGKLLDKLFNLAEIAWSPVNIPPLVQTVLTFNATKCSRTLLFEKLFAFFSQLRAQLINEEDSAEDDSSHR